MNGLDWNYLCIFVVFYLYCFGHWQEGGTNRSGEDEDDGHDTESKPLLSHATGFDETSGLEGVSFPYLDSSPIVQEANQKLESTSVDGLAPDTSIPSDLGDIVLSDPEAGIASENEIVEETLGARGLAGLSQSDSSLSSNNPSYRYGNQVEYMNECGEECDSYFPPLSDEDFMQVTDTDDTASNPAVFSERQPFIPQLDSFDSLSGVSFNPSDLNFDLEERKMTPIEELPPPPPELFRGSSLEDASPVVNGNNTAPPLAQHTQHEPGRDNRESSNSQSNPPDMLNQNCDTPKSSEDSIGTSQQFSELDTRKSFVGGSDKSRTVSDGIDDSYSSEVQTLPVNSQLSFDQGPLLWFRAGLKWIQMCMYISDDDNLKMTGLWFCLWHKSFMPCTKCVTKWSSGVAWISKISSCFKS